MLLLLFFFLLLLSSRISLSMIQIRWNENHSLIKRMNERTNNSNNNYYNINRKQHPFNFFFKLNVCNCFGIYLCCPVHLNSRVSCSFTVCVCVYICLYVILCKWIKIGLDLQDGNDCIGNLHRVDMDQQSNIICECVC